MKLIITDIESFDIKVNGEYKVINPHGPIHYCIGCFGCWVKTPGKCVIHDGYEDTGVAMGNCDEIIIISRCYYGSVSPFVKKVQDRAISYIQADFIMYDGEMHHKQRYSNRPKLSVLFYGENITEEEKATAAKIIKANVDNYDGIMGEVRFYESFDELRGVCL